MGASGAYYTASACDKVFSEPGSLVGSIGVIFTFSQIRDLLNKIGVKPIVLKSGKFKDTGSPFRDLTPEEKEYIEGLLKEIHQQFITDVSKARKMEVEEVKAIADGRVFTGTEAKKLGLIDDTLPYWKVVEKLSKDLGFKETLPTVVLEKKRGFWDRLRQEAVSFVRDVKTELLQEGVL